MIFICKKLLCGILDLLDLFKAFVFIPAKKHDQLNQKSYF